MEGNANKTKQDGCDKMLLIFILKLNKLHVLLYFSTYKLRVNVLGDLRNILCILN